MVALQLSKTIRTTIKCNIEKPCGAAGTPVCQKETVEVVQAAD